MEPTTGQTWGDYVLGKLLGKGSFGSVFLCNSQRSGAVYAVKFVNWTKMDQKTREASFILLTDSQCFST